MINLKAIAAEVLERRGQLDAARALDHCEIALRHVDMPPAAAGQTPQTDILIHSTAEGLDSIGHTAEQEGNRAQQIERAVTEALAPRFLVRYIQWMETEPSDSPRPGTFGVGTANGTANGAASGER